MGSRLIHPSSIPGWREQLKLDLAELDALLGSDSSDSFAADPAIVQLADAGLSVFQRRYKDYEAQELQQFLSLLARTGYDRRDDVIKCETKVHDESKFHCGDRWLCPRCAKFNGYQIAEEFGSAFVPNADIFYVTISLSNDPGEENRLTFLPADSLRESIRPPLRDQEKSNFGFRVETQHLAQGLNKQPREAALCKAFWRLIRETTRCFTSSRCGSLLLITELAVRFAPPRLLPHAHGLLWCPGITADDARELRRALTDKLRNCRAFERLGLHIVLHMNQLQGTDDLRKRIRYSLKPINAAGVYFEARRSASDENQRRAIDEEALLLFRLLPLIVRDVARVHRAGGCCTASSTYFGTPLDFVVERRERAKQARARQKLKAAQAAKLKNPKLKGRKKRNGGPRQPRYDRVARAIKAKHELRRQMGDVDGQ